MSSARSKIPYEVKAMKFDNRNSLAAKTMAFSAAIMAVFYLFEGFYFLFLGIQKSFWQVALLGALLVFYGSFRSYRNFQKYRNEKR